MFRFRVLLHVHKYVDEVFSADGQQFHVIFTGDGRTSLSTMHQGELLSADNQWKIKTADNLATLGYYELAAKTA